MRTQARGCLTVLQADFARCLALSAWAAARPVRMLVIGLPTHATLDDALLACVRHAGWPVCGLGDPRLDACWDSRWEFVAASTDTAARYQPGPSYYERLRLALLLDAWERASQRLNTDARRLDALAETLACTTAAFSVDLALPLATMRRAADERRLEIETERQLRRALRERLDELGEDDIRRLAIGAVLDGRGDIDTAVHRYGTPSMRLVLETSRTQALSTDARAELEPLLARLRDNVWAPFVAAPE